VDWIQNVKICQIRPDPDWIHKLQIWPNLDPGWFHGPNQAESCGEGSGPDLDSMWITPVIQPDPDLDLLHSYK